MASLETWSPGCLADNNHWARHRPPLRSRPRRQSAGVVPAGPHSAPAVSLSVCRREIFTGLSVGNTGAVALGIKRCCESRHPWNASPQSWGTVRQEVVHVTGRVRGSEGVHTYPAEQPAETWDLVVHEAGRAARERALGCVHQQVRWAEGRRRQSAEPPQRRNPGRPARPSAPAARPWRAARAGVCTVRKGECVGDVVELRLSFMSPSLARVRAPSVFFF